MFQNRLVRWMLNLVMTLVIALGISLGSVTTPAQAGTDAYLGEVTIVAFNFCPRGTAELNGQLLPISANTALFALLGCTYGGDCRATFALPDLRGRVPMHVGTAPGLSPRILGSKFGAETNQLLITNLPAHSHAATFTPSGSATVVTDIKVTKSSNYQFGSTSAVSDVIDTTDSVQTNGTVMIGDTGGNQPFGIIQPSIVLRYCITTQGIFPPRN